MSDPPVDPGGTFLTERQAEVLALRYDGHTQREIADRTGTTVSNISAIESAARDNVAKAERTVHLANVLASSVRVRFEAGTDLRAVVDGVYAAGDEADIKIKYTEPQLTSHLHDRLGDRLERRRLTDEAGIGITTDGTVVTFPSTDPAGPDRGG